jgi:hypothetical protein
MNENNINWNDWNIEEEDNKLDEILNKKFVKFLKDNNAYDKFITNLNIVNKPIEIFCDDSKKKSYINRSFIWFQTKEGFDFWENLNVKWIQFLNK